MTTPQRVKHGFSGDKLKPYLAEVQTGLRTNRSRQVLGSEIRKISQEIVYVESRLTFGSNHLERIADQLEQSGSALPTLREQLAQLKKDRSQVEKELHRFQKEQADIDQLRANLPVIAGQVTHLDAAVSYANQRLQHLSVQRDETLAKKERLMAEISQSKSQTSQLETEIAVFANALNLLQDQQAGEKIPHPTDINQAFDHYLDETKTEIDQIASEIKHLERQRAELPKRQKELSDQEKKLAAENEVLRDEIGGNIELDDFQARVLDAEAAQRQLEETITARRTDLKRVVDEVQRQDVRVNQETANAEALEKRHHQLAELKRRLIDSDLLDAELQKLAKEVAQFRADTRFNSTIEGLLNEQQQPMTTLNDQLEKMLKKYANLNARFTSGQF